MTKTQCTEDTYAALSVLYAVEVFLFLFYDVS